MLVDAVGEYLEVFAYCGDFFVGDLVAVGQVPAVGQVQGHYALVWVEEAGVDGEVGWGAREGLDVDSPLLWF